jgi:hypothetical protein
MNTAVTLPPVKAAVVTGGHSFDVVNFHALFRAFADIDAYVQHMDDFASASQNCRRSYDVIVFYTMFREGPSDDGQPWFAGKPEEALTQLGDTEQGILVLHHALLAYPDWALWRALTGIDGREIEPFPNQSVHVEVADPSHPITSGLTPWEMTDETYLMAEPDDDVHVLLAAEQERSMRNLAWTRQYRNSRVFCLQSGHDNAAWENPSFKEVLHRGLLWCARRT